jgi:hypothetical protein
MIAGRNYLSRTTLACLALLVLGASPEARADDDFFERRIRPVLVETCLECHGAKKSESGLRLDSQAGLLKGGERGAAVVLGKASDSLLVQAIARTHDDLAMPPAKRLPENVVADFKQWIDAGAKWPDQVALEDPSVTRRKHWSFQPLQSPAVPAVKDARWPFSPIDYFILDRLEQRGLPPVAAADKRSLLRRITFDLTGLPPTPEEVADFLGDDSPTAYQRLVDRLLASPAYGERWGRHWLDVVRYADTAGNPPDFPVPQAHRYRDYVIQAWSQDKPFDQFVREQIAGDLLPERGVEQMVATGYLAIGRRFFGTTKGPDHLEVEDLINTLGTSLLGLSLGCARCHDHKFDPIAQREYYALYGMFSSTRFPHPGAEGIYKQENFVPLEGGGDAYAVAEATPANARIHIGGEPGSAGDEVPRGFLEILGGQTLAADAAGSGRAELAQWLTDPKTNPLLPRVIVNRLWQHHFGAGLVRTPNDFGLRGARPTHPELLDYLASELLRSGWSLKALHREILLSSVYQLSSTSEPRHAAIDPANELLWHHPRRRLDAESIRDAVLAISSELDQTTGGAHPFPPQDQWRFSQHAPFVAVYPTSRRSVYLMQQRLKKHPFLALFDGPDANVSTASRLPTTTPIQSLFWMNDPWMHEQSERFAQRIVREAADDVQRLERAFGLLYARPPRDAEREIALAHLAQARAKVRAAGITLDADETRLCWCSLARVLLASNEFLYVD